MQTFRFIEFPVYRQAKLFYRDILSVTKRLQNRSLKDQIERAGLSLVLNIAEGSAKRSDKEFARYLEIAIGSINEVVAALDLMKDVSLIESEEAEMLLTKAENIVKQLGGFIKSLLKKG